MKSKLLLFNLALILFLTGLFISTGGNLQVSAIVILSSAAIATITLVWHLIQSRKNSRLWSRTNLALTGVFIVLGIIYIHGFSTAIGMILAHREVIFTTLYISTGFIIPLLFLYFNIKTANLAFSGKWLIIGASVTTLLAVAGFLGYARIIPFPVRLVFFSWVFILMYHSIFLLIVAVRKYPEIRSESIRLLVIALLFLGFWIYRYHMPGVMAAGLYKAILHFGFVPLVILPLTIISVRKLAPFLIFVFYFVFLDLYFIQFDNNFNYLVNVGINGCEGYDQATDYPAITDPGMPLSELMREPSAAEIEEISAEWRKKTFSPGNISVVWEEKLPYGDSLKIISHEVNGLTHYGAIRIPEGLNANTAPILLELEGGGTGMDISKTSTLFRGKCQQQRAQFISVLPSYRGSVIRGRDVCFRSEGYFGDPWIGPAEDAITLLEAVKKMYNKPDTTPVLASGISRGATVALIIGGLTDKADHIIAVSAHTKFLDEHVLKNERVGTSFPRAFYAPQATPEQIRRRMIASSPYYFADKLPTFELHQGAKDELTTVWHAEALKKRLQTIKRDPATYDLYIYENEGHGYDDDQTVCKTIVRFLQTHNTFPE